MSSKPHTDSVYKEKRIPKNPRKFNIQLNEEQKEAKRIILESKITAVKGMAGSGKTLLACQVGLDMLYRHDVEKIIISRPMITSGEDWGFLPGGINEKISPFTNPIYDNMYRLDKKENIDKLIVEGKIEVVPFGFMRGRNFSDAFVIIDEAQNVTMKQMKMVLSRMCIGSKIAIVGDTTQVDLKDKINSGFDFVTKHLKGIQGFSTVTLMINHRDPIVEEIVKVFDEYNI